MKIPGLSHESPTKIPCRPAPQRFSEITAQDPPSPRFISIDIGRREEPDALTEAHALKITELLVIAEAARAKAADLLSQVAVDKESISAITALVNAITRTEGTAKRAMAEFDKPAPEKPWSPDDLDELWPKGK
jgi:hypothetical protein